MSLTIQGVDFQTGLLIDGAWRAGRGEALQSVNPATEEVLAEVGHTQDRA